jgi:hypothetical protein
MKLSVFCHQNVITVNKRRIFMLMPLLLPAFAFAQNGVNNVEKLCGCFSVNFRYAETFSADDKYKFHEREDMNATELALPIEKSDRKIVMQHLLVISDTMVIKHWREEWTYESPVIYDFLGNKSWNKRTLTAADVKGKWTQTVWEVNDEPRYQGISAWINNDNKTYWESTVDAPLPRREYTTRSDYNILKRQNRIIITQDGYLHEQDNEKLVQNPDGSRTLIAQEKGYNTYHRLEDGDCKVAAEWWKKNAPFWTVVRNEWEKALAGNGTVAVKPTVADKKLEEYFTPLWKDWSARKVADKDLPGKVQEIIAKFL